MRSAGDAYAALAAQGPWQALLFGAPAAVLRKGWGEAPASAGSATPVRPPARPATGGSRAPARPAAIPATKAREPVGGLRFRESLRAVGDAYENIAGKGPVQALLFGAPAAVLKTDWDEHPGFAESLVPVWGSTREAVADWREGDRVGAIANGALALSDLSLASAGAKGLAKGAARGLRGGLLKSAPNNWRTTRDWLGKRGYFEKGQHAHHWAIPNKGWGARVPDWVKNQPWNLKGMASPELHYGVHGYGPIKLNRLERYWHGTPGWAKHLEANAVGHPTVAVAENYGEDRD